VTLQMHMGPMWVRLGLLMPCRLMGCMRIDMLCNTDCVTCYQHECDMCVTRLVFLSVEASQLHVFRDISLYLSIRYLGHFLCRVCSTYIADNL
jgi:hypothetical protein